MTQALWSRWILRVACAAIVMGSVAHGQGQERPNFSGTWELFTPELQAAEKRLARTKSLQTNGLVTQQEVDLAVAGVQKLSGGEGYVIVQDATTMSVTKTPSKQVLAIYKLDGSDSRYAVNDVPTGAKATWLASGQLVATETTTRQGGTPTQATRSWSLNSEGLLVMQWFAVSPGGGEVGMTALYRRAK